MNKKPFLPAARAAAGLLALMAALGASCAAAEFAPLPIDDSPAPKAKAENYLPEFGGYEDESLKVSIETTREYDTTITIARVRITHPSQMRTAMADKYGSTRSALPRIITKRMNSVFAVNGDFFNFHTKGYLVRHGKVYRENPVAEMDMLIIDEKGDFHIITDPTMEKIAAFDGEMVNTFTFGPALIENGELVKDNYQDDIGYDKKTQRMVMAQDGPLSYVFVATEGPENKGSKGLTIPELMEFVSKLGLQTAYNLDGGSSCAMLLGNDKINSLSSGKVRPLCDILYFATLVQ
ncbi:MAG: phosphodiester glycosidase family protein [Eubacteriales bacterium]|nr:phosphodiester glycosidase family protein [Eubacteriales bacterium]